MLEQMTEKVMHEVAAAKDEQLYQLVERYTDIKNPRYMSAEELLNTLEGHGYYIRADFKLDGSREAMTLKLFKCVAQSDFTINLTIGTTIKNNEPGV